MGVPKGKLEAFQRTNRKPYPQSAAHKLRRRLNVGLKTGKLDLSTQCRFVINESVAEIDKVEDEKVSEVAQGKSFKEKEEEEEVDVKAELRQLIRKPGAVDLAAQHKSLLHKK